MGLINKLLNFIFMPDFSFLNLLPAAVFCLVILSYNGILFVTGTEHSAGPGIIMNLQVPSPGDIHSRTAVVNTGGYMIKNW